MEEIPKDQEIIEENLVVERFICRDEYYRRINEYRNKCIRSILWTLECIMKDKNSEDFKNARKCVLDSVNEFDRNIMIIVQDII